MRFFTAAAAFLSVSAGLVAAQDTTTAATAQATSSTCAAQNIVDACLKSTTPQLKACASTDWKCLCDQSNNVLTCYNNCPGDPDQFGAQQTKESYCNAAKAYGSSSSTSASKTPGSSPTASGSAAATTGATVAQVTGSSSGSSAKSSGTSTSSGKSSSSTSSKNAASGMTVEAGSLAAAVLVGLGALL
ncbi:GPI anchored serine-threonine rich protein [Paecilomyces variotii No. 5]|uniref:GPI anchored serine-threonine rich protein n=1 Tax=Byssochlamys spectabilis (strain No. 5 / NBRC 109023) TaxID=1356009 RepID=V5G379_BYSSN|nr:GPI anchored serine-threonine rich protein [Paecilomyces variotii No. 5]